MSFSKTFLATFLAIIAAAAVIGFCVDVYNEQKHQHQVSREAAAIIRQGQHDDLYIKLEQAPTAYERDKIIAQLVALYPDDKQMQKEERKTALTVWMARHQ
jgi:hypothetical protein